MHVPTYTRLACIKRYAAMLIIGTYLHIAFSASRTGPVKCIPLTRIPTRTRVRSRFGEGLENRARGMSRGEGGYFGSKGGPVKGKHGGHWLRHSSEAVLCVYLFRSPLFFFLLLFFYPSIVHVCAGTAHGELPSPRGIVRKKTFH